ncbi:hypothetical protein PITCH_A190147 [uncultured Desulfobacterium sp.]|uniref:Uncharacterized protein n=1 Tax=uncultured Desulfobacterium sp. TaxID=201089 RepID=A0A445MW42_9BACT|nr:hypothetical protein PITCH_A190147 [uncultured Desulfobacterium sp.]
MDTMEEKGTMGIRIEKSYHVNLMAGRKQNSSPYLSRARS